METEVKLRVADAKHMRKRLGDLGFCLVHRRSLEDNILFDTPDRALRKIRAILRLRHYGGKWIVTFKGTPTSDRLYKSRTELELEVEKPQILRAIFEALGFHPVFRYQKYRSHYSPAAKSLRVGGSFEVTLDETPIGDFLELEGGRSAIDRVARQLGYTRSNYSTASYGALYLDECRKKNISPGDMVFPPSFRRRSRP